MHAEPKSVTQTIPFDDTFFFFIPSPNRFPFRHWQTEIEPWHELPSGKWGKRRIDTAVFWAENLPKPICLVWDNVAPELFENGNDDSILQFSLNGQSLNPAEDPQESSPHQLRFDLNHHLWPGENTLTVMSASSTRQPIVVQDTLALEGEFAVRQFKKREILTLPPMHLQLGSWTEQGFPFFTGTGIYRQKLNIIDFNENASYLLRMERITDMAEITINNTFVGPMQDSREAINITHALQAGENLFEFRIDNTKQEPTQPSKPSGLLGPVFLEVY
ncbi:hypothetical protein GF373_14955 [bacterium]|nr:hypothetical protein [bacterium]